MPPTTENPQGGDNNANSGGKDKKAGEPLFGPSIGSVSSGPAWTLSSEKKIVTDELTPDIVNGWIEKSKEPSHPTTTLQALVNLKRPTLRLCPLDSVQDEPSVDQHHHGLEFEYDCDAPKCGVYLYVLLSKTHPDAPATSSHSSMCKLQVFDMVVDGGFGNRLTLEDGALLELGRFEHPNPPPVNHAEPTDMGSHTPEPSSSGDLASGDVAGANGSLTAGQRRRRFTQFHFRRRSQNRSIAGPALAVVDAEPVTAAQEAATDGKTKDASSSTEDGVKVIIRLVALDEQGTELASPNEQLTYLHVVRFGQKNTETTEDGTSVEDTRPWVVKVVKREAMIGPHSFHLHEIYGLTSTSSHHTAPTAPPPIASHTYPPEDNVPQSHTVTPANDDDPQSECLLCLSSPREVVLLPCRHLVACKECALNMVEFGAGGNITQATEPSVGGPADDAPPETAGASAAGTGPSVGAAAMPVTPTANTRRKRKAKGWFCPVCRQPYTSMLRLTTSAPSPASHKDQDGDGSGTEDEGVSTPPEGATTEVRSNAGSLLGAAFRPGFLRALSISNRQQPADVENQNQTVNGNVNASAMARVAL